MSDIGYDSDKDNKYYNESFIDTNNLILSSKNKSKLKTTTINSNEINNYHSRMFKSPILEKSNFLKSLSKDLQPNVKIELKLFEYDTLREIIEQCGSYPTKFRNYVWKFLLSLPNNKNLFETFSAKPIHATKMNLSFLFPVQDSRLLRKLTGLSSLIIQWSEHVGNVYFLPNLIFPFIKCINGDDIFLFELIISFITYYCQYWFNLYPGAPLDHIKICEKIIEKENYNLHNFIKQYFNISDLIWRMLKCNFSENLTKDSWLQYMDFILTYNHRPEILLYFSASILLKMSNRILKSKNPMELENNIFTTNVESDFNLHSVFKLTLKLMKKYSKFQIYTYSPFHPFNSEYPHVSNFPAEFLNVTKETRINLKENQKVEVKKELEERYHDLLKNELKMKNAYESLVDREKMKVTLLKKENDLMIYEKTKLYENLKNNKIEKLEKLNRLIKDSMKYFDKMSEAEMVSIGDVIKNKKTLNSMDIKFRLQEEELNNMESEANRKIMQLLTMMKLEEEKRKFIIESENKNKEEFIKNRILEENWRIQDKNEIDRNEFLRNREEYELNKFKVENDRKQNEAFSKYTEDERRNLFEQALRERNAYNKYKENIPGIESFNHELGYSQKTKKSDYENSSGKYLY